MRHLRLLVLILIALLMCQTGALASDFGDRVKDMAEVTGVRVSKQDSKVRIVVEADKEVDFKKMVLSNPERVVVDLPNAWLSPKVPRDTDLRSQFAGKLHVAQFDKNTVRIVVETKVGKNNYSVFKLKGGASACRIVLDFGDISGSSDNRKINLPDGSPSEKKPSAPPSETDEVEQEMASSGKAEQQEKQPETSQPESGKDTSKQKHVRVEETPSGGVFEGSAKDSGDELDQITGLKIQEPSALRGSWKRPSP